MPHVTGTDPIAQVEERIRLARARRAACERFSEAYWEADDELAWLRMVRDEMGRTGHVRTEVRALLLATGVRVPVMAEDAGATLAPAVYLEISGNERKPQGDDSALVAGPA